MAVVERRNERTQTREVWRKGRRGEEEGHIEGGETGRRKKRRRERITCRPHTLT
jgi:hypothetical protein